MKLIALLVIATISLARSPAAAEGKIVLESFTGGKTDEHGRRIAPLLEALANHGFFGGYEAVGRKFEARVSRPAIDRGLPADFTTRVDAGHRAWIVGRFDEAIERLGPLVDTAHANTGAFAKNQDAREAILKALIALALSYQRIGDPAQMRRIFAEIVRSFPSTSLSRATYGPEAADAFDKVRRELTGGGKGSLIVRSNAESAVVFVNEKIEGAGTLTKEGLVPGEYRVFVLVGKALSRSHRVQVRAGEPTTLVVDPAFDAAVQTSPTWTGLAFVTPADRERSEVTYAARFGNALDAEAVAVVGIDHVRGVPAVVGALVNRVSGTEIRRASVALASGADRLKALAQFLAGENPAPEGVEVLVRNEQPVVGASRGDGGRGEPPVETPATGGRWSGWKYVAAGGAIAGLATGGILLAFDGRCSQDLPPGTTCTDVYSTTTPALLALGGGAALAAVSVYLFVTADRPPPARAAFVAPGRGGALVGITGRF
jgi:hypothetical protein